MACEQTARISEEANARSSCEVIISGRNQRGVRALST